MHIVQSPGGVERYLKMFFKYTDKSKFESILICSNEYNEMNFENLVNKLIKIDMKREINFLSDLKAIIKIRRLIKKYRPDIIYVHSSKAGALGRIANFGIQNELVYNPHGWAFCMDCNWIKKFIYNVIEISLSFFTQKIIAISECEKNRALQHKVCSLQKIDVILNGIDTDEYTESQDKSLITLRDKLNIPTDAYVIGLVGRICKNKAPEVFIEVAQQLKEKIPNSFFVLVGDGPDINFIKDLVYQKKLQNSVLITGWVSEPLNYIKCFDQGMLLTRWEGFGLVLTEYMLCRVPIIATNIDSIPELVENEFNGLLVGVDNVEEIVNCSLRIYENKQLQEYLTLNGLKIVNEKFDVKRMTKEHEELFLKMVK